MTLKTWFILLPCVLVGVVLTLANMVPVQFSLDPFSSTRPALAFTVPLIVVIMGAFLAGLLAGGLGAWVGQGGHRKGERQAKRELKRVQKQQGAANSNSVEGAGTALAVAGATAPALSDQTANASRHGG
ncbi:Permeases of the major facilitator superfamily [Candidatus Phaeomarinobacter ectocarpi]|uniref:Permeases of the major facilitator superfamily n=1 Tax=Candidatus Phaeomarinibacter ectocarpi TaxID=1458461 RepID=X5MFQ0_9HYPH|nr:lipopolysaccharide assembly protein LapA domain-containing protein [Candidatus Phaeomarinobacter ectocarpi]CDO60044.1 Permeases of the major facilitator superfamily [Candidatus Phaeomarinobacter ectocarpi]